jgi:hypothetical protein
MAAPLMTHLAKLTSAPAVGPSRSVAATHAMCLGPRQTRPGHAPNAASERPTANGRRPATTGADRNSRQARAHRIGDLAPRGPLTRSHRAWPRHPSTSVPPGTPDRSICSPTTASPTRAESPISRRPRGSLVDVMRPRSVRPERHLCHGRHRFRTSRLMSVSCRELRARRVDRVHP